MRITIQSEAGGGTIFWQELHSLVSTNASGMFTLVVGSGVKEAGTAGTFADIDWSVTPKFIKTEIDFGGWKDLGSSQLWSIPYAMSAGSLTGSLPIIDVTGASGDSRIGGHLLGLPNIEVNNYGTGNRYAFIDFHGDDTYPDYGLRLIRNNTGPDAYSRLDHRGLGQLELRTLEAAPIDFYTSTVHRMRISATGNVGIKTTTPLYSLDVNGQITSRSANAFRLRGTTYSSFLRNDNTNFYLLLTNSDDLDGSWNSLRPLSVGLATGNVNLGNGALNVIHGGNVGVGTTNPTGKMVVQPSPTWSDEVPLFEVKNKLGVPVFAVYNYGVRILVDHTTSKAVKGGFAIGGFDETKAGETVTLMLVTPDSIRFNIDNSETKAVKGGFAIGGFDETKAPINEDFMYITPSGSAAGAYNTLMGYQAGNNITTGINNSIMGYFAGIANTTGSSNVMIGAATGQKNIGGNNNVFLGNFAGYNTLYGSRNVYLGDKSGYGENGHNNVYIGQMAGYKYQAPNPPFVPGGPLDSSTENVIIGSYAGYNNTGNYGVILGNSAGYNVAGNGVVYIGWGAGNKATGAINTFIGADAGKNVTSGTNNVAIGFDAQVPGPTASNQVRIGNSSISYAGIQVAWTITSDIKWKESVKDLDYGLDFVSKLKPVDYIRMGNESRTREIGFIAQDVEQVLKELGITGAGLLSSTSEGNLELRYNDFIPILTKAIQEQQMTIESLEERYRTQQTELETLRTEMESIKALLLREIK